MFRAEVFWAVFAVQCGDRRQEHCGRLLCVELMIVVVVVMLIYSQERPDVEQRALAQKGAICPIVKFPNLACVKSVARQESWVLDLWRRVTGRPRG